MLIFSIFMIGAYLFGSVSSAILVCRAMHLPDPRTQGSHNPGATNVLRIGGKKAAALTLLGDMAKGLLPVLLAKWLGFSPFLLSLIGFAAFLGHLYPLFFRFQGGKGVATAMGVLLGLSWPAWLVWVGSWCLVAAITRYSSLAALLATIVAPFTLWFFTGQRECAWVFGVIALLLLYRHRRNIHHLLTGTEKKIGA